MDRELDLPLHLSSLLKGVFDYAISYVSVKILIPVMDRDFFQLSYYIPILVPILLHLDDIVFQVV